MPFVVERPLKAASDVVTGLGSRQTAPTRAADEEEVIVKRNAKRAKLLRKTLDEVWIDGLIGKGLPLDQDRPFAERR
jgi:hypothetical protein